MPRPRPTRELNCSVPVIEERLLKSQSERQALERLTQRGVEKRKLLGLLFTIPRASNRRLRLVPGMGDRTVRDKLPDQIQGWSDTVEKLNHSAFLKPDVLTKLATKKGNRYLPASLRMCRNAESAQDCAKKFEDLPSVLRLYADYLQTWTRLLTSVEEFPKLPLKFSLRGFRPRTLLTLELIQLVRDAAGKPFHAQIATLLNAAYREAGTPKKIVTEDDLLKLEQNNPWPRWSLSPEVFRENE